MRILLLSILMLGLFASSFGQSALSLVNPSFEDGTDGWSVENMTRVSNNYFSHKDGTYYVQCWVTRGKKIGDCSISQKVNGLSEGKYRLSASACHVQQLKSGSDENVDENAQTGVTLFAGNYSTSITTSGEYVIEFVITGTETYVTIGAKAVNATGNYFAIDNFQLTYVGSADASDYRTSLASMIATAQSLPTSTSLTTAIKSAQAVLDNESASLEELKSALAALSLACKVASVKDVIVNPSFEDGTTGWTVRNMATQNNTVFSRKRGTYYLESWVDRGNNLGDASVSQVVRNLPDGNYKMTAFALHIQQSGSNSTVNTGKAQTGAYLFAGNSHTDVTAMRQYTVEFSLVDGVGEVEIGLKAENATGNYLCVDYFTLEYVSEISIADYAGALSKLVAEAEALLEKGIQESVALGIRDAVAVARTALEGTGTDSDGNTIYDFASLTASKSQLEEHLAAGYESRSYYDALQVRIDYAEKVYGWWKDDTRKGNFVNLLRTAIDTANEKMTDWSLSTLQLKAAVTALNNRINNVDKKIYCSGSACGTDAQLSNPSSQWSYERSLQSKHWVLFWEAGYGTDVPAAVPEILDNADKIFEFYANDLKFITINQGKSKTDSYKMIIRLRETSEWEASGSGIDNTIGLLTLSRWAYTSRGGQTVAHEIGHCFQYQTHCDNGDWNGWMYNWGSSTLNVFWEMCAQWQAYKFYPAMQFNNEWLGGTLNGLHRHPLCVDLRYNNYFIQDYMAHKHGIDIIGRLWNESRSPEDPLQAYMRLTMDKSMSSAEKLDQLNDEMWEYGARMTTFDMDGIRKQGASTIGSRAQTTLTKDSEGYWTPAASNCIENFGNNAIRINIPSTPKTVYAELTGLAGKSGYNSYNTQYAGWKFGFVALKRDGTRVYGDIGTCTKNNPDGLISFECPANCTYLWLVVSGAPTSYWTRDWLSWSEESSVEQWPYKVKFYQTNVLGSANNNSYPVGIDIVEAERPSVENGSIYTLSGQLVRRSTDTRGLTPGIYIVGGKKVVID